MQYRSQTINKSDSVEVVIELCNDICYRDATASVLIKKPIRDVRYCANDGKETFYEFSQHMAEENEQFELLISKNLQAERERIIYSAFKLPNESQIADTFINCDAHFENITDDTLTVISQFTSNRCFQTVYLNVVISTNSNAVSNNQEYNVVMPKSNIDGETDVFDTLYNVKLGQSQDMSTTEMFCDCELTKLIPLASSNYLNATNTCIKYKIISDLFFTGIKEGLSKRIESNINSLHSTQETIHASSIVENVIKLRMLTQEIYYLNAEFESETQNGSVKTKIPNNILAMDLVTIFASEPGYSSRQFTTITEAINLVSDNSHSMAQTEYSIALSRKIKLTTFMSFLDENEPLIKHEDIIQTFALSQTTQYETAEYADIMIFGTNPIAVICSTLFPAIQHDTIKPIETEEYNKVRLQERTTQIDVAFNALQSSSWTSYFTISSIR